MDALLKNRRYLQRCLSRYSREAQNTQATLNNAQTQALLNDLSHTFGQYKANHEAIINEADDSDFEKYQDEFETFSSDYERGRNSLLADFPTPENSTVNSSGFAEVKLPQLNLPTFSGESKEWPSFVDLFNSAVGLNPQITLAQKLQYLKSAMQGEARCVLKHLPTTDAAYEEAWRLLRRRFENRRQIVMEHMRCLQNLEKISGTPSSIRNLIDVVNECHNALKLQDQSVEDAYFVFTAGEKLDDETRRCWELSLKDDSIPKHTVMTAFLEDRARALSTGSTDSVEQQSVQKPPKPMTKCPACTGNHFAYQCEEFRKISITERKSLVKTAKLCFNCLASNHGAGTCNSKGCKKCGRKHHTMLHQEPTLQASANFSEGIRYSPALLATALVSITTEKGKRHQARALLDTGSTNSFITEDFANSLNLQGQETKFSWIGIDGKGGGEASSCVTFAASPLGNKKFTFHVQAFVVKQITGNHPATNLDLTQWSYVKNLRLADPEFHRSRPVDILLGVDVLPTLFRNGFRRGSPNMPTAQNTALGWILSGPLPEEHSAKVSSFFVCPTLEYQAQRFWEIEDLTPKRTVSLEEEDCENFFKETTKREADGRYVVRLPFKDGQHVSKNKSIAFKRFLSLENKFRRRENFRKEYFTAIKDFQQRGHLIPAPKLNDPQEPVSYLPHHAVIKLDHDTTKLRVVFDASAKSKDSLSLNEALMNGPKLQDDLFDILLRFRKHQVVFSADIEKMYRQIKIHESDINFHRIFWRENRDQPIQEFCLTTVTFGVKPAPYLATRVLRQLAEDERAKFPEASEILKRDFYVDDLLSGADTPQEAKKVCSQLDELLKAGGFLLRKWASNTPEALQDIPQERRAAANSFLNIDEGEFMKTLGLKWNPTSDCFCFKVKTLSNGTPTKRTILSDICRTFDPLGWLSPFTVQGKIIFQELWKESLSWDDPVPASALNRWNSFKKEAVEISKIIVPRRIVAPDSIDFVLCGFADASEKAYSAAVYLKSRTTDSKVKVELIAAKTKVAPLKLTTITRLELNAALLLAKLMKRVSENLSVPRMHAWTDSTVTLAWIRGDPAKWKQYVAHRVVAIQEILPKANWHHVRSEDNPADCASRGIEGKELLNHKLWWHGPQFLHQKNYIDIPEPQPILDEVKSECKSHKAFVCLVDSEGDFKVNLLNRFSDFSRLLRVTAYVQRVIQKCKGLTNPRDLTLCCEELRSSESYWIGVVQREHFCEELKCLERKNPLSSRSPIVGLSPFLDAQGLIRVGGRLTNAPLEYEQKHPLLLPKKSHLTTLLVRYFHTLNCHAGPTLLLASLRRRYWITNGRNVVQKIIQGCLKCYRLKARGALQQMGNLPPSRVSPEPAFNICGVDYAGPITLKPMTGRKGTHKGYIAVFVCFTTKALHLELVSSLTSQAFIAALRRFVARRGLCYTIYSDCGTNFVGANRELRQMLKIAADEGRNESIANALSKQGIEWRFNPPGAPHFGGLWEAGVKSVKTHLHRILGNVILNFEEMTTVLTQIEACLNSRPLCEASADPADLEVLTPGHFLIGKPLTAIPEPDLTTVSENRLARFQLCQKLVQGFWKRWSTEYLSRLQNRPKWIKKTNFYVGQLVLLTNENTSPLLWKMARITELHPGPDGLVRVVSVRTSTGLKKRPVTKISPLPISTEDTPMSTSA